MDTLYPDLNYVHNIANPHSGTSTHYIQTQAISKVHHFHSLVDPDTVSISIQQEFTVKCEQHSFAVLRRN